MSAKIVKITQLGDLYIEFNSTMIPNSNLSLYHSELMDIYVMVEPDRLDAPGFELASLNFTWECMGFTGTEMHIFMNFSYPIEISPEVVPDMLVLHFKPVSKEHFISPELQKSIHQNWRTISSSLLKQIPNDSLTQSMAESAASSESLMKGLLIATFVMNLVLSGSMTYMISMIRSL